MGPDYHHGQIKANDNMLIPHVMLCGVRLNQQMSRYIVTSTDELLPLLPHPNPDNDRHLLRYACHPAHGRRSGGIVSRGGPGRSRALGSFPTARI
jgi:hypothetical protein